MTMMMRLMALLMTVMVLAAAPMAAVAQRFDAGPELDATKDYYALLITTNGQIPVRLFADKAPRTVQNFVNLAEGTAEWRDPATGKTVKRPYFNGLQFHRVIPQFMIQTGDPTATGQGGPGYKFQDEFAADLRFSKPGVLGMANSGRPDDNGSQFFITEVPTPHLNDRHTVFGEIASAEALEVVKSIAATPRSQEDRPNKPMLLERVAIVRVDKGTAAEEALKQVQAAGSPVK